MAPSLLRHVLVPAVPASLIAAPLASLAAGLLGVAWMPSFLGLAAPLAVLWGVFSWREERASRPVDQCSDPLFGDLVRYYQGDWEAQLDFAPTGGRVVVQIEAGEEGPSEDQRQRFSAFSDSFERIAPALSSAVEGQPDVGDLTLWGAMLPSDPQQDGELIAACSVAQAGREGVSWYLTLSAGQVVHSARADAA